MGSLEACVHCGFCLPACPTYTRLGDEADSPRGRLYLMRAVAEGRLDPAADAFQVHIDRCLGCRACEPACPSGVPYGALLEQAREQAARHRPPPPVTRLFVSILGTPGRSRLLWSLGRAVRDLGLAGLAVRLPAWGPLAFLRRGLLMLAGSAPWRPERMDSAPAPSSLRRGSPHEATPGATRADTVAVLEGCVQRHLFERVNRATEAILTANDYEVIQAPGQGCCGAIHAHAGDLEGARRLARANIAAFEASSPDRIAVNAAGCGAALREYGSWLAGEPLWRERAAALAARSHDISVLLAERGPRSGGAVVGSVAYHPPCHLVHAQGVAEAPLRVLAAIPGLEVRSARRATGCCGGAGIYGVTHPELGGRIGVDKARELVDTEADCVATGNPGCMMHISAFLRDEGSAMQMVHPVELLYESYRRAGLVPAIGEKTVR